MTPRCQPGCRFMKQNIFLVSNNVSNKVDLMITPENKQCRRSFDFQQDCVTTNDFASTRDFIPVGPVSRSPT